MNSDSDVILDAYYDEKMKIQEHYAHVIRELDIVRNTLAEKLANKPEYVSILNAMVFIRIQTVTNINFEVKEFNAWTSDDIPVSYYPSGMGKSEIAKIQDDIQLLDRVVEGHVYGNIFAAKSLVYVGCPKKREDICEHATQIFPLTLEQFGNYVKTIGVAIANLQSDVQREEEELGPTTDQELFQLRQDCLEATMKQLNVDILGPMNDWRDAYLGGQDDKSEVSRREMKL
ncbi:MAG: hypothetical protein JXR12_15405 [Neptunomonas phycophila]|uniref:hypothetical protein n=1 Tax=Neptunomonas phycophila TaxID=1572645 RepID=UPI003B8DFBAA